MFAQYLPEKKRNEDLFKVSLKSKIVFLKIL